MFRSYSKEIRENKNEGIFELLITEESVPELEEAKKRELPAEEITLLISQWRCINYFDVLVNDFVLDRVGAQTADASMMITESYNTKIIKFLNDTCEAGIINALHILGTKNGVGSFNKIPLDAQHTILTQITWNEPLGYTPAWSLSGSTDWLYWLHDLQSGIRKTVIGLIDWDATPHDAEHPEGDLSVGSKLLIHISDPRNDFMQLPGFPKYTLAQILPRISLENCFNLSEKSLALVMRKICTYEFSTLQAWHNRDPKKNIFLQMCLVCKHSLIIQESIDAYQQNMTADNLNEVHKAYTEFCDYLEEVFNNNPPETILPACKEIKQIMEEKMMIIRSSQEAMSKAILDSNKENAIVSQEISICDSNNNYHAAREGWRQNSHFHHVKEKLNTHQQKDKKHRGCILM